MIHLREGVSEGGKEGVNGNQLSFQWVTLKVTSNARLILFRA